MADESEDRCFCGAEWNDLAEECAEGHPFGEADKFRVRAEKAEAHAAGLAKLSSHLQSELDQQRRRADEAEHKLGQIRVVLENYSTDEHLRADTALGAINDLVNP